MRRRNPDDRTRRMERAFLASGDPELAEQIAREWLRSGKIPVVERDWRYERKTTLGVQPSYTAIMPDGGPALCLVPVNREILHVQIAPPEKDEREQVKAKVTHYMYGEDDEPWPGLPFQQPGYYSYGSSSGTRLERSGSKSIRARLRKLF